MGFWDFIEKSYEILEDMAETAMKNADKSLSDRERKLDAAERSGRVSAEEASQYREKINEARSKIYDRGSSSVSDYDYDDDDDDDDDDDIYTAHTYEPVRHDEAQHGQTVVGGYQANRFSTANHENVQAQRRSMHRRTDEEIGRDTTGMNRDPSDFSIGKGVLLRDAVYEAPSEPGVYIIFLNGEVMKCGRAAYFGGISWRFKQYYNLNYDDRARHGDTWAISEDNRDYVRVSWQCCPPSQCHELEYKLFQKYGKGPWAQRAPFSCNTDNWELLI